LAGKPVPERQFELVVAIFGPTASGKTAVAEAVAEGIGGDVVSADSMQAYRGLPILTAQPSRATRLVGIWPLSHEGSVAEYAELAHATIDELLAAGRTPVVAGGTGLYLRAALAELDLPPRALGACLRPRGSPRSARAAFGTRSLGGRAHACE
jgi:tRNA A37 N6-isopentenylltransferase MiaA